MRPPSNRLLLPAALLAIALPLLAQQGSFAFKHFKKYPASGQWSNQGSATMDSKPAGAPISETSCTSPLSPARRSAIMHMANNAAMNCTMNILRDEERTAEVEQVCTVPEQTMRTTLHAVDDTTIAIDVRSNIGSHETVMHSTVRYLGPCTAAQAADAADAAAAPLPSMKPSPEACAEVASERQQAEEGLKGCDSADLPNEMRPRCHTQMQGMLKMIEQVERSCKK